MKAIFNLLVLAVFFMASCHKEDSNPNQIDNEGVIVSIPYQWKKSLHESDPASNSYMNALVEYKGNIGISTTNGEGNRFLTMISPNTGDNLWQWNDIYQAPTERIDLSYYHKYNNLLTYQVGSRSYCINLDNGTTQ